MPNITGRVQYDGARTGAASPSFPGIQNVQVYLYDSTGYIQATYYTDATDGHFAFINYAAGNYTIAIATDSIQGKNPPISSVIGYPSVVPIAATHLDCTARNTFSFTIGAQDINHDFVLGPVRYTPLSLHTDPFSYGANILTDFDGGTFGVFPAGIAGNSGAGASQPYPLGSDFGYVQPQTPPPTSVTPNDGYFTVQNLMNQTWSNSHPTSANPAWWRISDHTLGNEQGRMMVVNGT